LNDAVATVVQLEVEPFAGATNRLRAIAAVELAFTDHADLVVLPELANAGFIEGGDTDRSRRFLDFAEALDGPFISGLREVARGRGHVAVGFLECDPLITGAMFNSLALLTPAGAVHVRRKAHLPRNEKLLFRRGNDLVPVETDIGRLGLLVCADNTFPEAARVLALRGCEVLAVSLAANRLDNATLYQSIAVTRAYENQIYVVAANQAGMSERGTFAGGSTICAPDGSVLAELGYEAGIASAQLEAELLVRERLRQTRFADRRPDLYSPLAEGAP
jgi:predicted amidohydrolase